VQRHTAPVSASTGAPILDNNALAASPRPVRATPTLEGLDVIAAPRLPAALIRDLVKCLVGPPRSAAPSRRTRKRGPTGAESLL
jgi:hypothetical protein